MNQVDYAGRGFAPAPTPKAKKMKIHNLRCPHPVEYDLQVNLSQRLFDRVNETEPEAESGAAPAIRGAAAPKATTNVPRFGAPATTSGHPSETVRWAFWVAHWRFPVIVLFIPVLAALPYIA